MNLAYFRNFSSGRWWPLALVATLVFAGCDRSPFDRSERGMDQGKQKQAAQDFPGAINSYETALDGTAKTSEAHFRMGIIYAEKLNDPVQGIAHFQRYVQLSPNGSHVAEAKANLNRLQLALATKLAEGTLISHTEAMKLKADNADLRKQLAAARASALAAAAATPFPVAVANGKLGARGEVVPVKIPPGARTYQVQAGDTLASISRKFYKTKVRAKDIQDANMNSVPNVAKLKTGQTLIIPE